MEIRQEQVADYDLIDDVHQDAFGQNPEAELVRRLRGNDRYIPELALVGIKDNLLVAHVMLTYIDLIGNQTWRVLGLAPLAVKSEWQKQGIGTALVMASMAIAETNGESMIVVLGHPQFYHKFGFEPAINYGIESPFPVESQYFMVKKLASYQPYYQGKIVYPPTFDGV